jgi:CRISPR/Cas system-associated exonuclease Cas4 (RecB family)
MARKNTKRLFTSPSATGTFYTCQQQFYLSRLYKAVGIEEPPYFKHGHMVHELLEGVLEEKSATEKAVKAARRLRAMEVGLKVDVVSREVREEIKLDGIQVNGKTIGRVTLIRKIDVVGRQRGHRIKLDYKTAGRKWKLVQDSRGNWVAPKGRGFQPVAYLLEEPGVVPAKKIIFLVDPGWRGQTFEYRLKKADATNFFNAIVEQEEKWRAGGPWILNRGYACENCAMQMACDKVSGWKEFYEEHSKRT